MTPAQRRALFVVRVVVGLLFWQHGLQKLIGFAGAGPEPTLWSIRGVGGWLEGIGGPMLTLGLFTRPIAWLLSGEMAVAYFRTWAGRGFFPTTNSGEEAVLNCFVFLWLCAAGAGAWSLDALLFERRGRRTAWEAMMQWEAQFRALLRVLLGFLITCHGIALVFGVLLPLAGRRNAPPLAVNALPSMTGYLDLVGGALLLLGVAVRPTSIVLGVQALLAYVLIAQPRALWPLRNGGIEALIYAVVFVYFAVAGAGAFSLEQVWRRVPSERRASAIA